MADPFRSKRLVYRAIEQEEDAAFFMEIQSDGLAYQNTHASHTKPQNKASAVTYMKAIEENLLAVVICLPAPHGEAKPVPIGALDLAAVKPQLIQHRFSEIGIEILRPYQGQGYGSEAIAWALDWAFDTAGLHRVLIRAFGYNTGALRLYERLGFTREGTAREELWHKGQWWDGASFSMLEHEWRALREVRAKEEKARAAQALE